MGSRAATGISRMLGNGARKDLAWGKSLDLSSPISSRKGLESTISVFSHFRQSGLPLQGLGGGAGPSFWEAG